MTATAETPDSASMKILPDPVRDDRASDDRVPADERVAGLDRRTIWPGAVLLIVWALWAHVMPWINEQIEVDNPIVAGDVVNLGFGEVTFVPAVGWQLESGVLLTEGNEDAASVPSSARLSSDVVSYSASSGNWDGTAEELADQMIDVNENLELLLAKDEQGRVAVTNADGVPGEIVYIVGVDQAALITTFVFEREDDGSGAPMTPFGVEIEVVGTPAKLEELVEEIASMIETTTYRPADQEENS
jgi:hypothetical protein